MKWFVLVVVMGMYPGGDQDIYVYPDLGLNTLEQCQSWVYTASPALRQDIQQNFEGRVPERVFCIREDRLKQFLEQNTLGDPI